MTLIELRNHIADLVTRHECSEKYGAFSKSLAAEIRALPLSSVPASSGQVGAQFLDGYFTQRAEAEGKFGERGNAEQWWAEREKFLHSPLAPKPASIPAPVVDREAVVAKLKRWMLPQTQPKYIDIDHPILTDLAEAADTLNKPSGALSAVVQYRLVNGDGVWLTVASFESMDDAEKYAKDCTNNHTEYWEYRALALLPAGTGDAEAVKK